MVGKSFDEARADFKYSRTFTLSLTIGSFGVEVFSKFVLYSDGMILT